VTRRFTLPTVVLASALAFLVGVVSAGRMATLGPSAARDGDPARAAAGVRPVSFADVAAKVNPAVVYIEAATSTLMRRADGSQSGRHEAPSHDGDEAAEQAERDSASGFLLSSDGEILTNHHVVDGAERLMVTLADGRRLPARVLGADPDADLALLKLDGVSGLPTVELGDSSTLRPGEWVCAIGNPLGYEHTVTVGVVSYLGRKLFDEGLDDYIQTDAAIDVGNSGGPLIDASGRVVGINTAISAEGDGIGFAVPINQARDVLDHLRRRGRALRGYMGVSLQGVDADLRRALGLGAVEGVLVEDVSANSPGERAGLRRYDVIESVEGRAVRTPSAVIRDIASRLPGTQVRLRIVRDGRGQELTVLLVERPLRESPPERADRAAPAGPAHGRGAGVLVEDLADAVRRRWKLPPDLAGVVIARVEPLSPADDADLQRGDVVLEVNRIPVRTAARYGQAVSAAAPQGALTLLLYDPRSGQRFIRTLRIDPQQEPD